MHPRETGKWGYIHDIPFSLTAQSLLFFECLYFPIAHLDFSMGIFFLLGLFFPEMCLFSTTPILRATCSCALSNSFTIFPWPLCLVLPDNFFYSRQSPFPLQLSLLILLHCRASFSLPPPLERRGGNISGNAGILHEWLNDISIQCIQTDML